MAHEVKWIAGNRIILNRYIDTLDMDDLEAIIEKDIAMMTDVTHPVYVIIDFTEMTGLHPDMNSIPKLMAMTRDLMSQPNLKTIVGYGSNNKMIKFLGSIVTQVGRMEWRFFNSYQETIKYLVHNDASLAMELENLHL